MKEKLLNLVRNAKSKKSNKEFIIIDSKSNINKLTNDTYKAKEKSDIKKSKKKDPADIDFENIRKTALELYFNKCRTKNSISKKLDISTKQLNKWIDKKYSENYVSTKVPTRQEGKHPWVCEIIKNHRTKNIWR